MIRPEMLDRVCPWEIAAYLRAQGWKEVRRVADKGSVWILTDQNHGPEILLPLQRSLRDYLNRVGDLLKTLEQVEGRSCMDILRDWEHVSSDVVRVSVQKEGYDHTVPIDEGIKLVQGARNMVEAAACSTTSPCAYHRYIPRVANEYMQNVCLGQTERGYTITLVSRVAPMLSQKSEWAEEPFGRRVLVTLIEGLHALQFHIETATTRGLALGLEHDRKAAAVSANLCQALLTIGSIKAKTVEVRVTWAATRPLERDTPWSVSFSSDAFPVIEEIGRMLRATSMQQET